MLSSVLFVIIVALLVVIYLLSRHLRHRFDPMGTIVVTISEDAEKERLIKKATLEFTKMDPFDVDQFKAVVLAVKVNDTRKVEG